MHHQFRLKYYIAAMLTILTLISVGTFCPRSIPSVKAQSSQPGLNLRGISSIHPEVGTFVISYENGKRICKEATKEEVFLLDREHAQSEELHVLSSIHPNRVGSLTIQLRATSQLEQFPEAKAAFQKAAAKWESLIGDSITVILDVDFGPTRFGKPYPNDRVIGSTSTQLLTGDPDEYKKIRTNLISGASSPQEKAFFDLLPSNTVPIDLIGSVPGILGTSAQFRALGILPSIPNLDEEKALKLGDPPAIGFNSNFKFDFDPSNGIDADKVDFDATAIHEIGHALGFISNVGARELGISDKDFGNAPSIWDLFRFRPGVTISTFSTSSRILSSGGDQIFFSGISSLPVSTGRLNGEGGDEAQASHWKARDLVGKYIGIMDPFASKGERDQITNNDLLAIETFGYKLTTPINPGDDTILPVVSNVSPKGGEIFTIGTNASITWTSTDNREVSSHSIALSKDSGQTFPITVTTGLAGTAQSYNWNVPSGTESTEARIRVTATDGSFNSGSAISAADFTIKSGSGPITPAAPTGLTATTSTGTVNLAWQKPIGTSASSLDLEDVGSSITPLQTTLVTLTPGGLRTQPNIYDDLETGAFLANPKTTVFGEQLTPPSYPATLKNVLYLSINSAFKDKDNNQAGDATGANFKLWVFSGPTGANFTQVAPLNMKKYDVKIQKDKNGSAINEFNDFNEFILPEDYTITSGSFFICLQFVDKGTSKLKEDGSDFVLAFDTDAPSTAVISQDGGNKFVGTGFTLPVSGVPTPIDFGIFGRAIVGSAQTSKLVGYNIYRSTTSPVAISAANKIGNVGSTTTSFTDKPAVVDGKIKYFYTVTAAYENSLESGPSNESSVTPEATPDTIAPTVKVLTPKGGDKFKRKQTMNITWESSDNVGVVSHSVSFSTNGGKTFPKEIATGLGGLVKSFDFVIDAKQKEVTKGKIRVIAKDAAGNTTSADSDGLFKIKPKK